MNRYLAKLRAGSLEKRNSQEPSKHSKPVLPVVPHGNTTAEGGFEGFESDRSRRFSVKQTLLCRCPSSILHPAARTTWRPTAGRRPFDGKQRTAFARAGLRQTVRGSVDLDPAAAASGQMSQ